MPPRDGGGDAQVSDPRAQDELASVIIMKSDHGDQKEFREPKLAGSGKGFAGWEAAIKRAHVVLPHDTKAGAAFMFRVVGGITDLYAERSNEKQKHGHNPAVVRMRYRLHCISDLFKKDTAMDLKWVDKLPPQADIYAVAFSTEAFRLGGAFTALFKAWGWAE